MPTQVSVAAWKATTAEGGLLTALFCDLLKHRLESVTQSNNTITNQQHRTRQVHHDIQSVQYSATLCVGGVDTVTWTKVVLPVISRGL